MSGKITDVDVRVAVEAYKTAVAWNDPNAAAHPSGIKAALESYAIAHEPVSWAEVHEMCAAYHEHERAPLSENAMEAAGTALLARRVAATRAEVVVTEEDVIAVTAAHAAAASSIGYGRASIRVALQVFADRLNGKHAAPVDPRVEIARKFLGDLTVDFTLAENRHSSDAIIADFLAKLDEVKP